jgi:hypothetical protein
MEWLQKIESFNFILLSFFTFQTWSSSLDAHKDISAFIIGPSVSEHYANPYTGFNKLHPGFGGEFQLSLKKWILGVHGYYMFKDSLDHKAYWLGLTAGYQFGSKNKLWLQPFLIIGGIKKRELYSGNFWFFALPVLSLGYKMAGLNVAYIPRLPEVTNPILIIQIKLRILSFLLKLKKRGQAGKWYSKSLYRS